MSKALIASHAAYGADIIPLTSSLERSYNAIWDKVLRRIFNQPRHTSTDALRFIAGQIPFGDWRRSLQFLNFQRFKAQRELQESKVAKVILGSHELQKFGHTFKALEKAKIS